MQYRKSLKLCPRGTKRNKSLAFLPSTHLIPILTWHVIWPTPEPYQRYSHGTPEKMVIKMDAFSFSTPCFCTTDSDACCRETQGKLETCLKETQWIWQTELFRPIYSVTFHSHRKSGLMFLTFPRWNGIMPSKEGSNCWLKICCLSNVLLSMCTATYSTTYADH